MGGSPRTDLRYWLDRLFREPRQLCSGNFPNREYRAAWGGPGGAGHTADILEGKQGNGMTREETGSWEGGAV